jgi:hypothetical protein
MEHTPQSSERQYHFRHENVRYAYHLGIALLVALVVIVGLNLNAPPAPPQADYYRPDPPMVDNSVEVNIFSKNQIFSNNCWNCAP